MEIAESIGWITLGFLPMFDYMEVAWRLAKGNLQSAALKRQL